MKARAECEREGNIEWTNVLSRTAKRRIWKLFRASYSRSHEVDRGVERAIEEFVDTHTALGYRHHCEIARVFGENHIGLHSADDWQEVPEWLAAIPIVFDRLQDELGDTYFKDDDYKQLRFFADSNRFCAEANLVLLEARFDYTFLRNRLRPRSDEPLHAGLILPAEAALTSDPRFVKVEQAYLNASHEQAARNYANAIMYCSTALHEVLRALGCKGETLKDLFNSARSLELFAGHDAALVEGVKKLLDWTTSNRSNKSIAHAMNAGEREDAQLALHVCAALIIRLIAVGADAPTDT